MKKIIIIIIVILIIISTGISIKIFLSKNDKKETNICDRTCPEGYVMQNKNSADCYCNGIPKKRNDVVINTDNWQEYFEFYTKVDWRKDDFGDITGLSASQNIKLKDIYHDKLVKKSVIKFKIEGKSYARSINIDAANQKYTLGSSVGVINDYETTVKMELKKNDSPSFSDNFYTTPFIELSSGVMPTIEDYNITKAEGTLYLYE